MNKLSVREARAIRGIAKEIKQLENIIEGYKVIQVELGLNLASQIEEMQEQLLKLKRGVSYV